MLLQQAEYSIRQQAYSNGELAIKYDIMLNKYTDFGI